MTMQDLTGQILGSYQLRELIGAGGMGAVYRGYQTTLERAVAVKVLSTVLASEPGYVERFYREAKTAAALEHAHIVPVHDFGIQGSLSYVVMRLLTGGTLTDRMQTRAERDKPLPSLGEVASLLRQIASALDYAHSQSVIHRDIKPSNIMFDNQGNAYLVDFGIAKLLEATNALTSTGATMGTPAFMPPEQWRSEELTPAADQYALGATIYALIVGRVPYEATTPYGLMHKHLNEKPDPPHRQQIGVPEAVSIVLERALAKQAGDRFPTATAFAQAFEGAASGQTGEQTGFFTASLVVKKPALPGSLHPAEVPTTVDSPPPRTPAPRAPAMLSGPQSVPAMAAVPVSRPIYRNPLVWAAALVVMAVLVVAGLLLMGGDEDSSDGRGTLGAGAIALAASETPVPTTAPTDEPDPTVTSDGALVVLPTETPAPTETPSLTSSPTTLPSDTPAPTGTSTLTPTLTPSNTPTATPTDLPTATATLTPTPTATFTLTPTVTLSATPTDAPAEVAAADGPVLVVSAMGAYLRERPSYDAPFERVGQGIWPIVGVSADGAWYQVNLNERSGWVRASAFVEVRGDLNAVPVLEAAGDTSEPDTPLARRPMLIIGAMGAYVRVEPSFDARFEAVSRGRLPIVGISADGRWYQVEYRQRTGWVRQSGFVEVEGDLSSVPVVGGDWRRGRRRNGPLLVIGGMGAYVRVRPSFDADFRAVSNVRLVITGISADGLWYRVDANGRTGWVRQSGFVAVEGDLGSVPVVE